MSNMIRIRINRAGIDYDRDYGALRKTGWTAVYDGCVLSPQFAGLSTALVALVKAARAEHGVEVVEYPGEEDPRG